MQIALPPELWARVRQAAKLNGRKPAEWAREALGNAARQQIGKHAARAKRATDTNGRG